MIDPNTLANPAMAVCVPFNGGAPAFGFGPGGFPTVFGLDVSLGGSWLGFAFVAMMAGTMVLTMLFFLSQLLHNGKLEAWVKFEFFQVLATAVLAGLIAASIWGMCTFDASILDTARYRSGDYQSCSTTVNGQMSVPPYCIAQKYLWHMRAIGQDIFQALMALNYVFSYMFKMVWESRPLGIGYTIEPLAGFQQLQNLFLIGISGFVVSFLSVIIQQKVLDYMLIAMPFFFMPIGIVLRSFPVTREFGGAVMALVISSLFFYPLLIVFNDVMLYSEMQDLQTGRALDPAFKQAMASMNRANWDKGTSTSATGLADYQKAGDYISTGLTPDFRSIPWQGGTLPIQEEMKEMSYFIFWPWQVVMVYVIAAVVLPLINFIVYVEIARGFSKLLGAELDLTNISRMI